MSGRQYRYLFSPLKLGPVTVLKKPLEVEALQQTLRLLGHKLNEKEKAA